MRQGEIITECPLSYTIKYKNKSVTVYFEVEAGGQSSVTVHVMITVSSYVPPLFRHEEMDGWMIN